MRTTEFNDIVNNQADKMCAVLVAKGEEYSRGGDRLSNFRRSGAMLGCTPERALVGMMAKHWISILDMVDDQDIGKESTPAAWDEKIGDAINYLVLLKAQTIERALRQTAVFSEIPKNKKGK